MAAFDTRLSFARLALDKGDFKGALTHADSALELDATSYDAHLVAGRAAYHKGNMQLAESEYLQAADTDPQKLPAWEGLANVQMAYGQTAEAAETYIKLGRLAASIGYIEKQREFLWRLGDAYSKGGRLDLAEAQLKALLDMPLSEEQRLEALCFLAEIQIKLESMRQEQRVHQTMEEQQARFGRIVRTISTVRLAVDASRADQLEGEQGSLGDTLKAIVKRTLPCPRYMKFHEHHLQRFLSRLGAYPPRSAARNEKRIEAMRECIRMITAAGGGCCTPFPFEAAIWLLEEQEELYGGVFPVFGDDPLSSARPVQPTRLNWYRGNSILHRQASRLHLQRCETFTAKTETNEKEVTARVEQFGMKLAHQFPWSPASKVAVGLALRRRFLSDPDAPSKLTRRKQIMETLKRGVTAGADSAAGWKALAELQYQSRMWTDAHATAVSGLEWSVRRRRAGHETLGHFALALRLVAARCLRRVGRLDEAEYSFKILAGWTTEGEVAFEGLAGSPPLSVRQQALRGLAKIAMERGDKTLAKSQYERILGKVLLGRGAPAEHWAHAEYAWLLFEDGDLQTARLHLEKALAAAGKEGCGVTDGEVAEHRYKLGRVLWELGGSAREDPDQAQSQFESASMEECDSQAQACAWLGHWYREVAHNYVRARNCYENALELDPKVASTIGDALQDVKSRMPAISSFANMPAFDDDSDETEGSSVHSLPGSRRVLDSGRAHSANTTLAGMGGITKAK